MGGGRLGWPPRLWCRIALFADAGYRPARRQVAVASGPSLRRDGLSLRAALAAGVAG